METSPTRPFAHAVARAAGWPSNVSTDIDLDKAGRSLGYLHLKKVPSDAPGEQVRIPIGVFNNGNGPKILILGGVHGDEFEGQIMVMNLLRELDIDNVRGKIIILPATNAPAALAGRRTSPIDDGDLNRSYPGSPEGTTTQQIAHLLDQVLLPCVEYLLDFHSGGNTSYVLPSAHVYHSTDAAKFARLQHMLRVFGMPYSTILRGLIDHERKAIGACDRLGVLRLATELGGGGQVTLEALREAEAGLRRLLFDLGALKAPMTDEPPAPTEFIRRLPNAQYVHTEVGGIFEPLVNVGDPVEAGQPGAKIHFPDEPWHEPHVIHFPERGFVHSRRPRTHVEAGDKLYMIHVPFTD